MPDEEVKTKGSPFIISAPSGSGKTSICKKIISVVPEVAYSVSYTTRTQRKGEKEGEDYFFISNEIFENMISDGDFLEWAKVHGNYYGTAKRPVLEKLDRGIDCLFDIDINGARSLKKIFKEEGIFIFLLPPSLAELKSRLCKRMTEDSEQIKLRIEKAYIEIQAFEEYQYVVVNNNISVATEEIISIIIAQRCLKKRRRMMIKNILKTFYNL